MQVQQMFNWKKGILALQEMTLPASFDRCAIDDYLTSTKNWFWICWTSRFHLIFLWIFMQHTELFCYHKYAFLSYQYAYTAITIDRYKLE